MGNPTVHHFHLNLRSQTTSAIHRTLHSNCFALDLMVINEIKLHYWLYWQYLGEFLFLPDVTYSRILKVIKWVTITVVNAIIDCYYL